MTTTYNAQCPSGHAWAIIPGGELHATAAQRAQGGALDALGIHPDDCPDCTNQPLSSTASQLTDPPSGTRVPHVFVNGKPLMVN